VKVEQYMFRMKTLAWYIKKFDVVRLTWSI